MFQHTKATYKRPRDMSSDRQDLDVDDEQMDEDALVLNSGKALIIDDIHRIYQNFQELSHTNQKLNLLEFNVESNGDTFMDQITQAESVFEYKK